MANAIEVEGISKRFRLGEDFAGYRTIRESLAGAFRRDTQSRDEFWALKDISFEVARGEVVGVIGRNGAGKTTLLRILSRITEPTRGVSRTHGSVGMLLDVGTGFHPELTGRENVFLNGAILGMPRRSVRSQLDDIIDFAGVSQFIDTPVKRYSAGMQARLAFAVAAHLEPEVLIVDEVLAVGDATFQRKCLGKMTEVAGEGRTVVFVSHNMTAIEALCDRAIWLDTSIKKAGGTAEVIANYLEEGSDPRLSRVWSDRDSAPGDEHARLRRAAITPAEASSSAITVRTPIRLEFDYWNLVDGLDLTLSIHIRNSQDILVFNTGPVGGRALAEGLHRSSCVIPGDLFNDGLHRIDLQFVKDEGIVLDTHEEVLSFDVLDSQEGRGSWFGEWPGAVRPQFEWSTEQIIDDP